MMKMIKKKTSKKLTSQRKLKKLTRLMKQTKQMKKLKKIKSQKKSQTFKFTKILESDSSQSGDITPAILTATDLLTTFTTEKPRHIA